MAAWGHCQVTARIRIHGSFEAVFTAEVLTTRPAPTKRIRRKRERRFNRGRGWRQGGGDTDPLTAAEPGKSKLSTKNYLIPACLRRRVGRLAFPAGFRIDISPANSGPTYGCSHSPGDVTLADHCLSRHRDADKARSKKFDNTRRGFRSVAAVGVRTAVDGAARTCSPWEGVIRYLVSMHIA